jgi:putative transcriptional regulator
MAAGLRFAVLLLACAGSLAAQSQRPEDLAIGKILVAPRDLPDPIFAHTVVLLVKYDRLGALGFVLNRQTTIPISKALSELPGSAKHADPVYAGGPVELSTVMAVARAQSMPDGADYIYGKLYLIAAKTAMQKALAGSTSPDALRIYLGYCGWGPGQLQGEIRRGGWYVFDRNDAVAFDSDPATLWSRQIAKAEMQIVRLFSGLKTGR